MSACRIASYRRRSISAIACSISVSHPLGQPGRPSSKPAPIERMRLVRAWINEHVKQLDTPVLDVGDVRTGDGGRPAGWTRLPEQPGGAIVAHGVSHRGEDEA